MEAGTDLVFIQQLMGHKDVKTTQIYARIVDTKISDDMKKLKLKLVV